MIFAAGLGTRLAPITDRIPKALVEVGGKTALQRAVERLGRAGISEIIVNVHHFPDQIIDYLAVNDNFGMNILISDESDRLLDTGGGLVRAIDRFKLNEPILLYNADILTDIDLSKAIAEFNRSNPDALLLAWDRPSSRRLLFDNDFRMRGWKNMSTSEVRPSGINDLNLTALAFGGIHIVAPTLFDALHDYSYNSGEVFSITQFYISVCGDKIIKAYSPDGNFQWWDIGKHETLSQARAYFDQ